jgi:hypothetical protein
MCLAERNVSNEFDFLLFYEDGSYYDVICFNMETSVLFLVSWKSIK